MANCASESGSSTPSPTRISECFCGSSINPDSGSIYCSITCARSDAFSSLCYKPAPSPSTFTFPVPYASSSTSSSAALMRNPSSTSSSSATSTNLDNSDEWNGSHYRRLARADIRKEERKEERRRRRDSITSRSTNNSISSSFNRDVPDLIGGHSRNASIASSISSAYTIGSLSRNPSSASTSSSRYGARPHIDTAIMEDDDEEWLSGSSDSKPYASTRKHRRRPSNAVITDERMKAFGMGKDMRDVLEEIIQMEKGFSLSDSEENEILEFPQPTHQGIFTATFDKPPRTPSPTAEKRQTRLPNAPGAPSRGHRLSMSLAQAPTAGQLQPGVIPFRPPSMMGHQSSLSESHTALYLATASPAGPGRRSVSPTLVARKSLTFTPDKAGPSIGALRTHRFDSPAGATPSRRRGPVSPNAVHPTMDGWKFPTASNTATPTRPPPINTSNLPNSFSTPTGMRLPHEMNLAELAENEMNSLDTPHLLWPPSSMPPPPLAPALFPSSPAFNTPEYMSGRGYGHNLAHPPRSGLRLGVLLGSGDDVNMDMDMDMGSMEDDDGSTAHGHEMIGQSMGSGFLPVYLEADGFRW